MTQEVATEVQKQMPELEPVDQALRQTMYPWGLSTAMAIEKLAEEGYPGWSTLLFIWYTLVNDVLAGQE